MTEYQDQFPDPPRLLDLEGLPPELEASLLDAAQDGLDEGSVARVTEGVIGDLGLGATAGSGGAGVLGSVGAKVLAGVVGVGVLVGGVWLGTRSEGPHVQEPAVPVVVDVAQEAPVPLNVEPVLEPPTPVQSSKEVKESPRPPRNVVAPPPTESASSLAEEHRLLRAARGALPADPGRALALTREHERRFPRGVLAQEREVIAIRAMALMGDRDGARKKAEGFDEAYPGSPHRDRVNEVTGGK
jgi:hypothetical protein